MRRSHGMLLSRVDERAAAAYPSLHPLSSFRKPPCAGRLLDLLMPTICTSSLMCAPDMPLHLSSMLPNPTTSAVPLLGTEAVTRGRRWATAAISADLVAHTAWRRHLLGTDSMR